MFCVPGSSASFTITAVNSISIKRLHYLKMQSNVDYAVYFLIFINLDCSPMKPFVCKGIACSNGNCFYSFDCLSAFHGTKKRFVLLIVEVALLKRRGDCYTEHIM